tara:strand:- start:921 stop:1334 length:414 start_codon:yes stop_codon:yes gene_type:complete
MESAIRLEHRNGWYAKEMGLIHLVLGDAQSALWELERSARLRPGFAEAERWAATINEKLGNSDRAVYWYELALESEPYGPFGLWQAAVFYSSTGESRRMYERMVTYEALQLDVLDPVIADVYEALGDDENAERVRGD